MKYYQIIIDADLPVIGKYPQVKELKIDFHKARASQWGIISQWKSEDDIPDLNNFVFQRGAKPTDVITNSFVGVTSGLFLSEKAKDVLAKFVINGSFYPMTIYQENENISYNFMWFKYKDLNEIVWNKSVFIEFYEITNHSKYGNITKIDDFEDYKFKIRKLRNDKVESGWTYVAKEMCLKGCFDITPAFGIGLICNENVKIAIEENHLSGFLFKQLDIEIVFD